MPAKKENKPSPAIMGNNSLRCTACGEETMLPFGPNGLDITMFSAMCKAFEKTHGKHKQTDAGLARYRYSNPDEWFTSWDTGTSSQAIYATMTGKPVTPKQVDPPRDVGDFGRCRRLLRVAPQEWTDRMIEVASRFPAWLPLVDHWGELTRLYDEEIGVQHPDVSSERNLGTAPKLYARIKELRGEAGQ
jgi:hypothetical protein